MRRIRGLLWLLVPAALALSAFESIFAWAAGSAPAWGYWAFCAGLAATSAALAALCAAPWGRSASVALAVWSGAHGWLLLRPFAGLVLGVAVFAVLEVAGRRGAAPRSGLPVALALGSGFVFLPRLARSFARVEELRDLPAALPVAVTAAVLAALLGANVLRRRRPGLPGADLLAALAFPLLAVLPLLAAETRPERHVPRYAAAASPPDRPSILVLVMDTVRADHLSLYGYERDTTPNLRAFFESSDRARLCPLAHAPGTWTLASHASLFTGTIPSSHGVDTWSMFDFATGRIRDGELRAERTLAEALREAGYRTAFVSANSWMRHVAGMERGFDWFLSPLGIRPLSLLGERLRREWLPGFYVKEGGGDKRASVIDASARDFLEACAPGPCLLVTNYMEAHAPLLPSRGFAGTWVEPDPRMHTGPPTLLQDTPAQLAYKMARYDEEILELDAELGRFLAWLDEEGWLDRSWLVITADHGEGFGEHGVTEHGTNVYGGVTHVPLLIQPPAGVALPPCDDAVSLIDVTRTLSAAGGAEPVGDGRDLRDPGSGPRAVQIEFFGDERKAAEHGPLAREPQRAAILGDAKLLEIGGRRELYRLRADPGERQDRLASDAEEAERLGAALPPLRRGEVVAPAADLSPDDEAELRALGYID
jgi:arylsulfatase A-like enzyme